MDKYSEVGFVSGKRIIKETFSEDESREFAKKMGEKALKGDVYTLIGDLGVGKTVFTQGFAAGLEIKEYVNSPTFTIVQEYQGGRLPLYHFDVYRISDISEMEEIGYEDYFYGDGVSLIEWADLIEELIPKEAVNIIIEKDMEKDFNYRRIIIENRKGENNSFN